MSKQNVTARIYDKRGRLLSVGHNSYTKTHPRQAHFARMVGRPEKTRLHAEIDAICKASRTSGIPFSISVERRSPSGKLGLAKPCSVCQAAISAAGIRRITYSV